jgi:large subunit ribosomal protein L9
MKLILTRDVGRLGSPGDIVEVKDGYGRNFLLPRGYAIPWSRGAERQIATIRRSRELHEVRDLGQARDLAAQLEGLTVRLESRAGQGGRLFGSVTAAAITDAVRVAGGPAIDKRRVDIHAPIKTIGSHTVTVRLHPELSATLTLEIVPAS